MKTKRNEERDFNWKLLSRNKRAINFVLTVLLFNVQCLSVLKALLSIKSEYDFVFLFSLARVLNSSVSFFYYYRNWLMNEFNLLLLLLIFFCVLGKSILFYEYIKMLFFQNFTLYTYQQNSINFSVIFFWEWRPSDKMFWKVFVQCIQSSCMYAKHSLWLK